MFSLNNFYANTNLINGTKSIIFSQFHGQFGRFQVPGSLNQSMKLEGSGDLCGGSIGWGETKC